MNPEFSNASKTFKQLNPKIFGETPTPIDQTRQETGKPSHEIVRELRDEWEHRDSVQGNVERLQPISGGMNKTEHEYSLVLESMKQRGEILSFKFHGVTLRYANGELRYTPDFWVSVDNAACFGCSAYYRFRAIEVKGAYVPKTYWQHARQRFLSAKADWPEIEFQMVKKTKSGFERIM